VIQKPHQFSIAMLLGLSTLVAIGISSHGAVWFWIAAVQSVVWFLIVNALGNNIPTAIKRMMQANGTRADGSTSSKRNRIEELEKRRFKRNVSWLVLAFLIPTNMVLLTFFAKDFSGSDLYVLQSEMVKDQGTRTITQAQWANERGNAQLALHQPPSESEIDVWAFFMWVFGFVWFMALTLTPLLYLSIVRTLAREVNERAAFYRIRDLEIP